MPSDIGYLFAFSYFYHRLTNWNSANFALYEFMTYVFTQLFDKLDKNWFDAYIVYLIYAALFVIGGMKVNETLVFFCQYKDNW